MKNWNDLPNEMKIMVATEMDSLTKYRFKKCSKQSKSVVEATPLSFWDDLPYGIKNKIVDKLDFISRNRLKITSKMNCRLVNSIPLRVAKIKVAESYEYDEEDEDEEGQVTMNKRLHVESRNVEIDGLMIDTDASTLKIREGTTHRKIRFSKRLKKYSPVYLLRKSFVNFMLTTNVRMKIFDTSIIFPSKFNKKGFKINAERMKIDVIRIEDVMKWLNVVSKNMKALEIMYPEDDNDTVLKGIGTMPVVMNCESLWICRKSDINDDELLDLKATKLIIINSQVTANGINQLLKKWISEDARLFTFMYYDLNIDDWSEMLEGLEYETIECEAENEKKAKIKMDYGKDIIAHYGRNFHVEDGNVAMSSREIQLHLEVVMKRY